MRTRDRALSFVAAGVGVFALAGCGDEDEGPAEQSSAEPLTVEAAIDAAKQEGWECFLPGGGENTDGEPYDTVRCHRGEFPVIFTDFESVEAREESEPCGRPLALSGTWHASNSEADAEFISTEEREAAVEEIATLTNAEFVPLGDNAC